MAQRKAVAIGILTLTVALYAASLSQIAFCLDPHGLQSNPSDDCYHGWAALVWGPLSTNFTWFANPISFISWFVMWSGVRKISVAFCLAALLLAASFMLMKTVARPVVELSPAPAALWELGLGYWLWLLSMGTALVAALLFPRSKLEWP